MMDTTHYMFHITMQQTVGWIGMPIQLSACTHIARVKVLHDTLLLLAAIEQYPISLFVFVSWIVILLSVAIVFLHLTYVYRTWLHGISIHCGPRRISSEGGLRSLFDRGLRRSFILDL